MTETNQYLKETPIYRSSEYVTLEPRERLVHDALKTNKQKGLRAVLLSSHFTLVKTYHMAAI